MNVRGYLVEQVGEGYGLREMPGMYAKQPHAESTVPKWVMLVHRSDLHFTPMLPTEMLCASLLRDDYCQPPLDANPISPPTGQEAPRTMLDADIQRSVSAPLPLHRNH